MNSVATFWHGVKVDWSPEVTPVERACVYLHQTHVHTHSHSLNMHTSAKKVRCAWGRTMQYAQESRILLQRPITPSPGLPESTVAGSYTIIWAQDVVAHLRTADSLVLTFRVTVWMTMSLLLKIAFVLMPVQKQHQVTMFADKHFPLPLLLK